MRRIEIVAHRGASGEAPENTLAAFRLAIAAGADGVELDVQASADGVPVVIHDERLGRTAGAVVDGPVQAHTLAELQALDAGRSFAPAFAGERIPALAEVLELLRPTGLCAHVELKTSIVPYPGLVAAVLALVARAGMEGRVVLCSFNHHSLVEAGRLAPHIPRAAVLRAHLVEPWHYLAAQGFAALHPEFHGCTAELVRGCHGAGLAVRPYTVNEEADARALLALGVDGLLTNHPARMVALRDRLAGEGGPGFTTA